MALDISCAILYLLKTLNFYRLFLLHALVCFSSSAPTPFGWWLSAVRSSSPARRIVLPAEEKEIALLPPHRRGESGVCRK